MPSEFNPERIERPFVKEWGHHAVYVQDYDSLLSFSKSQQRRITELEGTVRALATAVDCSDEQPLLGSVLICFSGIGHRRSCVSSCGGSL